MGHLELHIHILSHYNYLGPSPVKKHKKHKKHKHKKKYASPEEGDDEDTFVEVESVDEPPVKSGAIKLKIKLGGQTVAAKR